MTEALQAFENELKELCGLVMNEKDKSINDKSAIRGSFFNTSQPLYTRG